ncbi:MAG TPA: hybrid sensor histidine kinase/response regulator [Methanomassiliicoccales archaeon]|jgi:signal transduction histidine kinase
MSTIKNADRERDSVHVLAVEDNPGDLGLVREYLYSAILGQYRIASTGMLSKALEMLGTEDYDVILLDLNLPDSRGFDTFTKIHCKFPQVPIVVLTGSTDEGSAAKAINEGAQDYLFKNDLTSSSLSHAIIFAIERKRIELELIAEKGRAELYLDLLTHDINNYITAALGYLQLAEMRLQLEDKDKKLILIPMQELRNSSELIANVRNIQRLEADRYRTEMVEIGAMLEEIKGEYEHPPGREVRIAMEMREGCRSKVSSLLRDAFGNIVSNAIKHSTGPLVIGIALTMISQDGDEHCRISIEDNGPGIADEMKEKVFDRSTRGGTKATGHGLGLYLVKRLVEDQGGWVWAEDRVPGDHTKGARFVIVL